MKQKICFVLPEYARATHFQYVAEFVEGLAEHADVFLVIEKGELPEVSNVTTRIRQRFRFTLPRFIEIAVILFSARLRGYRTQYVHYSFSAAFWSAIITRLSGGTTYYWNAGMPWLYHRSLLRELFERLVYKLIGKLVTGAEAIVADYARYYGIPESKIIVIPNWIDDVAVQYALRGVDRGMLRRQLDISPDAPVVLFVHRLSQRKGAHLLPQILHALLSGTILVILGEGPEGKQIEEEFSRLGLADRVRMQGAVPQQRVVDYFALADVFLLPSEEEGCPHVLLESLAAGVPYAAFAVGGVREMTPDKLLPSVCTPGDIGGIIAAANTLIALPKIERDAIVHEEHEWVKRYRKEEILARFLLLVR